MFTITPSKDNGILQSLGYWALLLLTALLPIVFFTAHNMPSLSVKIFFGSVLVLIIVMLFSVTRIREQSVTLPRSLILGSVWLLPIVYLLSALFAPSGMPPLFGKQLMMDSLGFVLVTALALTLTAVMLDTPKRALGIYLAMLASAAVLMVAELLFFFARDTISSLGLQSISLVGTLNDLGVFFGLITIFILLSLIILPLTNKIRIALWVVLLASLFLLAAVNLEVLWWIIGAFALAFFVHGASNAYLMKDKKAVSYASLLVFLVSSLYALVPPSVTIDPGTQEKKVNITAYVANMVNIGEYDIRPSFESTVAVGRSELTDGSSLFGAGPGTFVHSWAKYIPDEINVTQFWLYNFSYGIGFVPTSIITTGILGALAWIVFLGVFVWRGTRSLLLAGDVKKGDVLGFIRVTSFVAALYLWINMVIQVPSPALVLYAALLTGVFISSLGFGSDKKEYIKIAFKEKPRVGFLATLTLTILILGSAAGVFGLFSRFGAELSYQKALTAIRAGDVDTAEKFIKEAIDSSKIDEYYRVLSSIYAYKVQALVAENRPPEEIREELQSLLGDAVKNANAATELDKHDYQNWVNLGGIYQSAAFAGVGDVVESAISAYDQALALRPKSPQIFYSKAILERARGDNAKAREFVQQAITHRNQYTDANFLLAQIQIEEGNVDQAIRSVEAIVRFNPQNSVAFFQLGLLYYSKNDFRNAVHAFERSTAIDSTYANARYFLALSYWKLGDRATALAEFKKVQETNADNADLAQVIQNMESGKEPFVHREEEPKPLEEGLPFNVSGDGASRQDTDTVTQ